MFDVSEPFAGSLLDDSGRCLDGLPEARREPDRGFRWARLKSGRRAVARDRTNSPKLLTITHTHTHTHTWVSCHTCLVVLLIALVDAVLRVRSPLLRHQRSSSLCYQPNGTASCTSVCVGSRELRTASDGFYPCSQHSPLQCIPISLPHPLWTAKVTTSGRYAGHVPLNLHHVGATRLTGADNA